MADRMQRFLVPLNELDVDRVLANWKWILPKDSSLVAVTCFGDLFVESTTHHVHWLDTLEGELHTVANSIDEWRDLLHDSERVESWFWPGFVESLDKRGETLAAGECYAWQIHPRIGGPLESENLKPMSLIAYHAVISELHQFASK